MTTLNDLESKRIMKIKNLNNKELNNYLDSLVFKLEKSLHEIDCDNIKYYGDLLQELKELWGDESNICNVTNQLMVSYHLAYYRINCIEKQFEMFITIKDLINKDITNFINHHKVLSDLLSIYYWNYSNESDINILFEHLEHNEKVQIPFNVREKCLNDPKIVENTSLMHQLDELIVILKDLLIKDARCIEGHIKCIKLVPTWIKQFKEDIKVIKCDDKMRKAGGVNLIN